MLRIRHLGRVSYAEALDLQHALSAGAADDYLLLVEHPAVYTLGARADRRHVLVDPASVGAELVAADRGGDVTFHGPGQLVAYPLRTLPEHPGAGPAHVHDLEDLVIAALADVGLTAPAGRLEGYPGVWLGVGTASPRKIAAVGVRTQRAADGRRRSLHGVAVNVDCDLTMFGHIVPCGIEGLGVTSLSAEGCPATVGQVARALADRAARRWGNGGVDEAAVTAPATTVADPAEPALRRRLRQAGVEPEAGLAIGTRKPQWLRVPARMDAGYRSLGKTIHDLGLVTVCEEAGCPNIFECWAEGTATFMINGERCTRACGFCLVDTRRPMPLDPHEPARVAEAVARMGLAHAVVTCVARDDLADGGAGAMADTVAAIGAARPGTAVEVLMSDCKGDAGSQDRIFAARPDIVNHNIETVARLQRAVRPSAGYARSLTVLARARAAGLVTKSGLMVGLGERPDEVVATLADLAAVGVSIATIGQYLRPTADHLPVARWWTPAEFAELAAAGLALGLSHVEASPLTRSSHHARGAAEAVGVGAGVAGDQAGRSTAVAVALSGTRR